MSTTTLDAAGARTRLDDGTDDHDVTGRLLGGCIDTLSDVVDSPVRRRPGVRPRRVGDERALTQSFV